MLLDNFSLKNKVAIVTGCSTGLGQGICIGMAEAGAKVVGVDYVDAPETKELIEKAGGKFLGIKANLLTIDPIQGILGRIPADRWGLPADVAGPAVFLASSASDYVNGYTLAVDGGWLAR